MIKAEIIADSLNEFGNRITTMVVTFPRIILAEFNTHRMFSRNSASSRAIPFEKMVKSVQDNPFIPIAWQKDHKGMQGTEYLEAEALDKAKTFWMQSLQNQISFAKLQSGNGLTKQIVNRGLEQFMWHTVIVTATEWENFFALRCPRYVFVEVINNDQDKIHDFRSIKDYIKYVAGNDPAHEVYSYDQIDWLRINQGQAEIHMMTLAEAMWDAYNESKPRELNAGEWHIPFYDKSDKEGPSGWIEYCNNSPNIDYHSSELFNNWRIKIATARCARVSYTVVGEEGKPDNYENDIKLHDRLLESKHASPTEHCAQAQNNQERSRNFIGGWKQYREILDI